MSTSYSPNIVTNGLVLYLDAANSKSIVSGSNTWRDLSGNNTNASLVNGVGYSSANKGSLTFDGVNDHASFTRPTDFATSSFSIVVWVKFTSKIWTGNYNTDLQIVIDNNHSCYPNKGFVIQDRPDFTAAKGYCPLTFGKLSDVSGCVGGTSSSFAVGNGKWHCVVGTADINYSYLYVDGVYQGRDFNSGSLPQTTITLGYGTGGRYYNGQMGLVQLYNRTLSSQEVLQNYNSTKGRYGL